MVVRRDHSVLCRSRLLPLSDRQDRERAVVGPEAQTHRQPNAVGMSVETRFWAMM